MIKVNLLRRSTAARRGATQTQFTVGASDIITIQETPSPLILLVKLACAGLVPALLIYYEKQSYSTRRQEFDQVTRDLQAVETELTAKSTVSEVLKQYSAEKTKLENQVEAVRKLNKSRLREMKALDTLQSLMPSKVWLQRLRIESGEIGVTGFSLNSEEISKLVKAMEESVFFREVLLTSTTEETSKQGSYKKFELRCGLGTN